MRDVLPIVSQLADCQTDAARADWLHTVPLGIIHREQKVIHVILKIAGFDAGLSYLAAAFALTSATREPDGSLPLPVMETFHAARLALDEVKHRGEPKCALQS